MQIVIDIPDRIYKINQNRTLNIMDTEMIRNAIRKGTPLPKGHGRLIDADDVTDFEGHYITTDAPTIIEADK